MSDPDPVEVPSAPTAPVRGRRRFPWRVVLYILVLGYLYVDLKVVRGPLRQALTPLPDITSQAAVRNQWVATVNLIPITRAHLDLGVMRHLYQRGQVDAEVPEKNRRAIRLAVLQTLIDESLVSQYAEAEQFTVPEEEIDAFVARWEAQFRNGDELSERSGWQGLSSRRRREILARTWTEKRWIESRIEPALGFTDDEVRQWFDLVQASGTPYKEPEKVRARQIFISTVIEGGPEREALIRRIHEELLKEPGKFEELAAAHSGDQRTAKRGGDLNWFSRSRLPRDFTEPVFALAKGETSGPFQTSIGWHIVQVTDRQEERLSSYGEVAAEVRTRLENDYGAKAVSLLLEKLRSVSRIKLYPEHI